MPAGEGATSSTAPAADRAVQAGLSEHHSQRHRTLRVRITDLETGRLKVALTLPAGLVAVATRLGARLVPPGPQAGALLDSIERGELADPVVFEDATNGEAVEISLDV
jgi:translation initiation factor 2 gamma subunit (eIF-2gamma)